MATLMASLFTKRSLSSITLKTQLRYLHVTSNLKTSPKVGLVGMGHVGNAVCNNLLRKGFEITAMTDIKAQNCQGFPKEIKVSSICHRIFFIFVFQESINRLLTRLEKWLKAVTLLSQAYLSLQMY